MVASRKPEIVAALGARGTGKSAWVKQLLERARPTRLAVWDLMQEYQLEATGNLGEAIRAMKARTFRIAFQPSRDDLVRQRQFELWCAACLHAGRMTALVEELAFVTTPIKAPRSWREMCLLGRHARHQLTIIGTSQRPAQVDKEFFGNLDVVHVGRLANRPDAQKAAELLGIKADEVQQLPDLHWIERRVSDVEARRGVLSFTSAPARSPRASVKPPKARNSTTD